MTKIFSVLDTEIHDHYIIIAIFAVIIGVTYLNVNHAIAANCHVLEPSIDCSQRGMITRDSFNSMYNQGQFVFIPSDISLYHMDEFRQKPQFGNMHVECPVMNNTCSYHYDTFNGVIDPLNTFQFIAHAADNVSTTCWQVSVQIGQDCFGVPDYMAVLMIWSVIVFGGYYVPKTIILFIRSRLS